MSVKPPTLFSRPPEPLLQEDVVLKKAEAAIAESSQSRPVRGPSLKARALGLLARREHTRAELKRKLASHASSPEILEALLDELQAAQWQSDTRYTQGLVRQRAAREGALLIAKRLRQQGVEAETVAEVKENLRLTEGARLRTLWEKRYGRPPVDAREYARQFRYLAARGFAPDAVRRLLAGKAGAYAPDEDFITEPEDP